MSARRTAMEAVIVEVPPRGGRAEDAGDSFLEAVLEHYSSEKWELVLDVRAPDGRVFRHRSIYKIANRLGGWRALTKSWVPLPGLQLPVLVTADQTGVDIDWPGFVARGGINQAVRLTDERRADQAADKLGDMFRQNPTMAAQQREQALAYGPDMARQVPTGGRPAHEFTRQVRSWARGGVLTPDEAHHLMRLAGLA